MFKHTTNMLCTSLLTSGFQTTDGSIYIRSVDASGNFPKLMKILKDILQC